MNTTIYDSGLFCNRTGCKGKIIREYSKWIEYGEILGPSCPRYEKSSDHCFCNVCAAMYWPKKIIEIVKADGREMEIISEDPSSPPAEPEKNKPPHLDLFRQRPGLQRVHKFVSESEING